MGMHRSGTSILARSLSGLGLFLGFRLQRNHEAILFRRYNDHLFTLSGARWDQPGPARVLEEPEGLGGALAPRLEEAVSSYQSLSYLGPARYLKYRGLPGISEPWGWKDPRNTFLLGLWLRVFPGARVIHLVRHGVDVAASLRRRHQDRFTLYETASLKAVASMRSPPNPAASLRCATLHGGFTLWQDYLAQGRAALDRLLPEERALELRFETLALEPEDTLRRAAEFSGLEVSPRQLRTAAGEIRGERAQPWREDPELLGFAREVRVDLEAEGYGDS